MVNASFFEVDYTLAMVAHTSLLIAKSSSSVGWSCPETAQAGNIAIKTTGGAAVGVASKINKAASSRVEAVAKRRVEVASAAC
jgi:hypothetical protein